MKTQLQLCLKFESEDQCWGWDSCLCCRRLLTTDNELRSRVGESHPGLHFSDSHEWRQSNKTLKYKQNTLLQCILMFIHCICWMLLFIKNSLRLERNRITITIVFLCRQMTQFSNLTKYIIYAKYSQINYLEKVSKMKNCYSIIFWLSNGKIDCKWDC